MTQNQSEELIAVIHLFRHGQRGPISFTYPNDPYKDYSYGPIKKEELTNKGKRHMYELGKSVRERYSNFLSPSYSNKEYCIFTSEKDRSIVSAQLYSAGLFPPDETEIWHDAIKWNPIPTYMKEEPIFRDFPFKFCPAYLRALEPLLDELWERSKNDPIVKSVVSNSGLKEVNFLQVSYVYESLKTQKSFGLKLPSWGEEVLAKRNFILDFANIMLKTDEMKRLFVGCFLNDIIQYFKKMQTNPTGSHKFIAYSGHDTNIMNILMILGVFDQKLPIFGEGIFFELWKKKEEYYINIYRQREHMEPITIKGAEFDCKFEKFLDILKQYSITMDEFYKICK